MPDAKTGAPVPPQATPPVVKPAATAAAPPAQAAAETQDSKPVVPPPAAPKTQVLPTAVPAEAVMPEPVTVLSPAQTRAGSVSLRARAVMAAVFGPTLLALFYFALVASPMYVAEARFAVRGAEGIPEFSGLAAMFLPAGTSVGTDAHIVAEYIHSPDIMEAVDAELGIFRHFADPAHDMVSRLGANATRDERLSYWQWAVKPSFDPETGIIALAVKAYDPAIAKRLAEAVLARSEALVNAMSRRAQEDAVTLAVNEVKTAERRVSAAQEAMRAFRNRTGMLDPTSTAGGLQGIVSQLEGEVVKVRAEIAEAETYMSKDAPPLVGLRARLNAVEAQLATEKLRLAGEARPDSLTSFAGEYEELLTESEFARQQLVSAMTSLETARVKAEAKSRYVVAFQTPALPDESLYPRPWLFTAYAFAGSLALTGIVSLIIAAVREHAGF